MYKWTIKYFTIPVVLVLFYVHVWHFVLWFQGCKAEVSLGAGGGHSQVGWAAEEDRQGCRGLKTILGGTACGQAGEWLSILALLKAHQCWTLPCFSHIVWLVLWLYGALICFIASIPLSYILIIDFLLCFLLCSKDLFLFSGCCLLSLGQDIHCGISFCNECFVFLFISKWDINDLHQH